jgi:hypothetical protein
MEIAREIRLYCAKGAKMKIKGSRINEAVSKIYTTILFLKILKNEIPKHYILKKTD